MDYKYCKSLRRNIANHSVVSCFIMAIKFYVRNINNQSKLFKYARELGIEKKVYEVMEIMVNAD